MSDGLYFDETAGDRYMDGITGEYLAVIRKHGPIDLWSGDGEHYIGTMPAGTPALACNYAITMAERNFNEGMAYGEQQAQASMRAALGIK